MICSRILEPMSQGRATVRRHVMPLFFLFSVYDRGLIVFDIENIDTMLGLDLKHRSILDIIILVATGDI